jgi:cytochrome b subunit of formate dehydrogenase
MIQRIRHSRHFLACLLSAATGMALYFRAPFPEDNIFLRVMAIRSLSAFLFLKYSYTLFLYTTPYLAYSILFSASTFSPSKHDWAYAKRAHARGDDLEVVIQRIADYRGDKNTRTMPAIPLKKHDKN